MRLVQLRLSLKEGYGAAYEIRKINVGREKMKDTLKYISVLFSFCFAAGLLLSATYALTQPRIAKARQEQQDEAVKEVMPQAKEIKSLQKGDLVYYAAMDGQGRLLGYIFISESRGYSSLIRAAVSITPDGKIINIKVLEQKETPGIGSQITEAGFLERFKGKTARDEIDAISGATISSSALIKSVKATIEKIFP